MELFLVVTKIYFPVKHQRTTPGGWGGGLSVSPTRTVNSGSQDACGRLVGTAAVPLIRSASHDSSVMSLQGVVTFLLRLGSA